jgi:hypothetical protein
MREENGERCNALGSHRWGYTFCCCRHYDRITALLLDLSQAVAERKHAELLALYESYSRQIAKLTGPYGHNLGDAT